MNGSGFDNLVIRRDNPEPFLFLWRVSMVVAKCTKSGREKCTTR